MQTFQALRLKIEKELVTVNFRFEPAELYDPIRYTMEPGGKRIRPVLVLMACDLFEGDVDNCVRPALAVELFHNFTLLHDDIMDNAAMRRGRETVYKKWSTNAAILSGDTMFALAYELLSEVRQDLLPRVLSLFTATAREVCEGQQYDMNFETRNDVSISEYLRMIRLKTAVLLGCSLKLGAICGGASAQDAEFIYRFGESLGLGFQLQDDLLDVFGEVEKFGKEIGGDIEANKKTYLYLKALESAGKDDYSLLQHYFSGHHPDPHKKIAGVKEIYEKLQIHKKTEEQVNLYHSEAIGFLNEVKVNPERKEELIKLAGQLLNRDH